MGMPVHKPIDKKSPFVRSVITKQQTWRFIMKQSRKRGILILMAADMMLLAFVLSACVPNLVIRPTTPDIVIAAPQSGTVSTGASIPSAGSDIHFIQQDDYFITNETFDDNDIVETFIGKMMVPASESTKYQGQFLRVYDGKQIWIKHYAKTRVATAADLALGNVVYYCSQSGFHDDESNYIFSPPENITDSRNSVWCKARITDLSETFKGIVMTSTGRRVQVNALRVEL